ncbi:Hypothetical protein AA314_00378 [Archangium gephyra]|uniref:Uncharacterized protein n=1 Tax=Archangium gephyra TaxID=48 RepID=A0AAC8TAH2_9BACT|nr:Hypothetical protein AA314_00378 [Archangium gephyra]
MLHGFISKRKHEAWALGDVLPGFWVGKVAYGVGLWRQVSMRAARCRTTAPGQSLIGVHSIRHTGKTRLSGEG